MDNEVQKHEIQAKILRALLFKPRARFSELNTANLSNDHFSFHINRLLELQLVEKIDGEYSLTTKGKEYANRMDTDTTKLERQAKTAVCVIGVRERDGKQEILIQQRLKQPYFGYYGFVTGKIRWGEKVLETAKRELGEETGLVAKRMELAGVEHKVDIKEGVVLEDKYFYVVKVFEPAGSLNLEFEGGKNAWMTEEMISNLPKKFGDIELILDLIKDKEWKFVENEYEINEY